MVGGYHKVPEKPGLGVELDMRAVEKYRVPDKEVKAFTDKGERYAKPPARIINTVVYTDGSCVHLANASQGYGYFGAGHGPAQKPGTRLEPWPDDGSKAWKKLYEQALEHPVREVWKPRRKKR